MTVDVQLNPAQTAIIADIQAQKKQIEEREALIVQFIIAGHGIDPKTVTGAEFTGSSIKITTNENGNT